MGDGRTDGMIDRREERTVARIDERTSGWTDGRTDRLGRTNGWTDDGVNRQTDNGTKGQDEGTNGRLDRRMYGSV